MRPPLTISCILLAFLAWPAAARAGQGAPVAPPSVTIPRVDRAPKLADFPEMEANEWARANLAKIEGFRQRDPKDGEPATQRTEAYLGYDDKRLYAVILCFDTSPGQIRARMLRRGDALVFDDDLVNLYLDTFHDQRRAYVFALNPYGIQVDAMWTEQSQDFDNSFDTVWDSAASVNQRGYAVWMAIPFKSLRFPNTSRQTWGVIVERVFPRANESSAWPHISSRIEGRLNQAAQLEGLEDISPGRNIQLTPYGVFRSFRALDKRDPLLPRFVRERAEFDGGLDAKFVLKDSLVLDVAANPDFGQVESDEPQVTVNERFEVFFPEKRPFFIENASYFGTPINLLFTRHIADPQFGVRLTGKVGRTAIGALLADDESPGKIVPEGDPLEGKRAWFGVVRVSRDIFRQSSIGLIFTDREFQDSFNRVYGIDGRLKLGRNWVTQFQGVTSHTRTLNGERLAGPAYDFALTRSGRKFKYGFEYNDRSPGFRAEPGFLQRSDVRKMFQRIGPSFYPRGKYLTSWGCTADTGAVFDHSGTRLDFAQEADCGWDFIRHSWVAFGYEVDRERLRPQDFPGLPANRDFSRNSRAFSIGTSYIPQLTLSCEAGWAKKVNVVPPAGQEPVLADTKNLRLTVTLRPTARLSIENTYLGVRLLQRGTGASIFNNHIARSKWNWQFNRELSLRVILRYDAVLANPELTALQTSKNFNADVLITYLVHPGTALYLGYNSNLQNIALVPCPPMSGCSTQVVRTDRFSNDAKGFFVKFSYLLRF